MVPRDSVHLDPKKSRIRLERLALDVAIKLGLQISNFSYGTGPAQLFPTVLEQTREADEAGFDAVFVMDHLYQLPHIGPNDAPMLEAYTTLGALATATQKVQLGTLVTSNTYRNPTLLAKVITTLDVISQGRAILGIGAGWFELEHQQLGFEFGTFTDRFDRLGEALQIIVPMIEGERPTVSGRWYHTEQAVAEPRYRDRIPLLMGAGGEKKAFRMAVRHFDHLNLLASLDQIPAKLAVLRERCHEIGRDPATLETSVIVVVAGEGDAESLPEAMRAQAVVGSPAAVAEQIQARVLDAGVDGVILSVQNYTPGKIAALGEALSPLVHTV